MRTYSFVTTWHFPAPIEAVWEAIRNYQAWPSWWPSITEARQVHPGDAEGLGETVAFTFRTRLPYRLRFQMTTTSIKPPFELDGRASGELAGTGRWRLSEEAGGTKVVYYWDVGTTQWWMNLLAPIARPAFEWNHDQVMEAGRAGLARLLAERQSHGGRPATAARAER